jgi:hypothetical protein
MDCFVAVLVLLLLVVVVGTIIMGLLGGGQRSSSPQERISQAKFGAMKEMDEASRKYVNSVRDLYGNKPGGNA